MLLLQNGPGPEPGDILTAPYDYHLLLGILMLVLWPLSALIRASDSPGVWRKKHRQIMLILTAFNAATFTAIIYYTFLNKEIIGYELDGEWAWLDTLYTYYAIYEGEQLALCSLYLLPIIIAIILLFFLSSFEERLQFIGTFFMRYPMMIVLSYLIYALMLLVVPVDFTRLEVGPVE
ncbi:MAG: hypothetical protein EOP56_12200 [Sphingobacteriales bacterium]|nr:MAG: hypothetical protein EOP56_12200 [Sphingobacteriales bacterium]